MTVVRNYLDVRVEGAVLLVGLNRPQKRNAMSLEMMHELRETFSNIPDGVGAAVIYSTSQHFCTGLDLSEIRDLSVIDSVHSFREWHATFDLIQFGKVPVIAAITGAAIGGGLEIATACSLRVVDDSAFFSLPEGMRGLYVGVGASVRFPRIAGIALMTDMMLTGRTLYAQESYERGIAQYLVPTGQVLDKAIVLANKVASNLPMTNYAVTHVLPRIVDQSQQDGLVTEALIAAVVSSDARTQDRLADFLDRKNNKIQTAPTL
ncbi:MULTISPECIES: crotonase/enoyl-CoA hydratase family protein [Pseudomonas]|uniref:Crotonase/enoyl-CoA hydratase family protein n=1 Tax=Pseudomonas lini TaxID=163011 RepID=A0A0J6HMB6_9PSED|nr:MULTISPECIES: crotonase/enoyl-CoA hydratase family protein [Pseudomonas]KAB0507171.1 crotonase/enoyl-CoA hydratase family protein [Pseudomonas lini]KMM95549.1 enoyl-CoA hydratase [Pseudomonas lini]KNH44814.1 enoyl-CoA hydratase [Pseudomonas lini]MDT9673165.1 crotonase/enoyl-CoA hydratase family protein [Pseudomonas sp. JV414]SDT39665.1 Enoyl-CoA hydratase/carnithine racemase [Pseudomonas lini]